MFVECFPTFSYPRTGWRYSHGDLVMGCEIIPSRDKLLLYDILRRDRETCGISLTLTLRRGKRSLGRSCDGMRDSDEGFGLLAS